MSGARRTVVVARIPEADTPFAAYARVLEEAATAASSAVGHPPEWYAREGTAWVIRRTTIDCAATLAAGSEVEVTTWVTDFRRVRSRRRYELRLAPGAEPVLRGDTDWVYVDRAGARPKRISAAMIEAFVPGGAAAEPREALAVEPPPAAAFVHQIAVTAADEDALGHVNNTRSFAFVERAMSVSRPGRRPRAVHHDLEYLDEARAGDRLRCSIWPTAEANGAIETDAEIVRASDGRRLTIARSRWVVE